MGGFGVAMPQPWLHASLKSVWSICLFRAQNVLHWTPLCGRGAPWEELFIHGLWESIPDWENDSNEPSISVHLQKLYRSLFWKPWVFYIYRSTFVYPKSHTPNKWSWHLHLGTECPGHAMVTARHESHVTCLKSYVQCDGFKLGNVHWKIYVLKKCTLMGAMIP